MGKAIILSNCNFSAHNLGKVTFSQNIPIISLTILGLSTVSGNTDAAQYSVEYLPAGTTQRGISWSIISGGTYASISSAGTLTVLAGANNNSVTIKVQSTDNPNIYDTKTITVSYSQNNVVLTPSYGDTFITITASKPVSSTLTITVSSGISDTITISSGNTTGTTTFAASAATRTCNLSVSPTGDTVNTYSLSTSTIVIPSELTLKIVGTNEPNGDIRAGVYYVLDTTTMKQVVGSAGEVTDNYKEYIAPIEWSISSGSTYGSLDTTSATTAGLNLTNTGSITIAATVNGKTVSKTVSATYDITDYIITSFADLEALESAVNNGTESSITIPLAQGSSYVPTTGFAGAHFRLASDIDCGYDHVEIGQYNASKSIDKYFAGIFDGAGYKLYNIGGAAGVNGSASEGGLVGSILIGNLKGGTIRNIELYGSVTHSTVRGMGGVCAFVGGNCKIENVYNACDYTYNSLTAATMDLFAGWANNTTPTLNIKDCIYAGIATNVRQIPGFGISHANTYISRSANIGKMTVEYGQVTGYTSMAGIGDTAVSPLETLTSCYQIMGMQGLSKGSVGDGPGNRHIGGKITNGYEATVCIGDMESGICSNYTSNTNTYSLNSWTNGTAKTATELKNNLSFSTASDWIQSDGFYPINNNQWAVKALVLDRCKNGYVEPE